MFETTALIAVASLASPTALAVAAGYEQDFSRMASSDFVPVTGRAQEGTTLDITADDARQGQVLCLSYRFSGPGHVNVGLKERPRLTTEGDQLAVRLRVRGSGRDHFTKASIRFVDANGEFLQYPIPSLVEAANGEGWRDVRGSLDLKAFTSSWGGGEQGSKAVDKPIRFQGFALDYRGAEAVDGEILFDDLAISEVVGAGHGVELEVVADRPLPIFEPRQPLEFKVGVRQDVASGAGVTGLIQWRAYDFHAAEVASGRESIAWGEDKDHAATAVIRFTPDRPGIFYLDVDLLDNQGSIISQAHTRAASFRTHGRPVASEPFRFGVGGHPARSPNDEAIREIELARMIGFSAFRFDYTWSRMEPEEGRFAWEQYDVLIDAFAANGLTPQAMVGYSPRWASTASDAQDWRQVTMSPPRIDAYTAFLRRSVERYGDRIKHWEIWNEPDISGFWRGSVEQYAELFNASIRAIHATDPAAKVLNGGFSETKRRPDFIPRFLELANPKPDIVAFHSHNAFRDLVQTGFDIERYLRDAGQSGVPVWMNEAGATNHSGTTERAQAILAAKRLAYAPSLGHRAYLWYDLRNDGDDPNAAEHNYGLVRRDFSPKASAVAAHHVITQLAGKRFVRRFDLGTDLFALLYSDGDQSVLVAWNERASAGEQPRLFRSNAARVRTMNLMGVEQEGSIAGGVFAVRFGQEPHFVLLDDATEVSVVGNVIEVEPTWRVAPGSEETASVEVANPFDRPLTGSLSLVAEGGWAVAPATANVNVPPGEQQRVVISVKSPQSASAGSMRLALQSDSLPHALEAIASLEPAVVAPHVSWAKASRSASPWDAPQATLNRPSNVVSLYQATPMKELHFGGPDDLSAEVFLGHDDEGVILVVRARDDVHVQEETVGEMWRGDSLQFALATPSGQLFEWSLGLTASGPRLMLHLAPPSVEPGEQQMDATATRADGLTTYAVRIPRELPGVAAALEQGCGLNVLINDNDGAGRKGWVEWTPGIGQAKDPSHFAAVVFE